MVNPFIGTGGHGHTYPGATLPFGMVQLSPDTRLSSWDGCSGYHYSDSSIIGFSHTHLSGTGCLDYGDILIIHDAGAHAHAMGFGYNAKLRPPEILWNDEYSPGGNWENFANFCLIFHFC